MKKLRLVTCTYTYSTTGMGNNFTGTQRGQVRGNYEVTWKTINSNKEKTQHYMHTAQYMHSCPVAYDVSDLAFDANI